MEEISITTGVLADVLAKLKRSVAGSNPMANTPDEAGRVAGFWLGLWHGAIAPVTFLISLFSDKAHVYEVHNSGKWYILGFLLGVTAIWGGAGRANSMPDRARGINRKV